MPRDIDISQSLEASLSHIAELGEECGILESELEPYGRFKAKVTTLHNNAYHVRFRVTGFNVSLLAAL